MTDYEYDTARLLAETPLHHCERHEALSSTNDRARELAATLPPGAMALVLAEEQTAGRGRGANRWWTGRGSIAGSLLFDPGRAGIARERHYLLSLATALAIVDTVAPRVAPRAAGLHWPNDVFVDDRKLAGILVEAMPDGRHIVGFGLNANNRLAEAPSELHARVCTLRDLTGKDFDRTELLIEIVGQWARTVALLADDAPAVGRRAHDACLQVGERLAILVGRERTQGICVGIDGDGSLLLDTPRGRQRFYSGVLTA